MIENIITFVGYVSRYNSDRKFGFVETDDKQSYFFKFDKVGIKRQKAQGIINDIHVFCSGDEVEFQLRPSNEKEGSLEAYNMVFLKNERRDALIIESLENEKLHGYIKLVDNDKLFIKHISTYVYISVEISEWENNLQETYYDRLEALVSFTLTQTNKISKLKARLTDVRYIDDYYELLSIKDNEISIPSIITGKNSVGLYVTILDGKYQGFVLLSQNHKPLEPQNLDKYKKGEIVDVFIKNIPFNNKNLRLTKAEYN
jgi:cold shock CspA family protein